MKTGSVFGEQANNCVTLSDYQDRSQDSVSFIIVESLANCVFPGIKNVAVSIAVLKYVL